MLVPRYVIPRALFYLPACGLPACGLLACVLLACGDPESSGTEGDFPGDCTDGIDNDGDSLIDCAEPACISAVACCPDGDGDGQCDADDPCPADNPDDVDGDGACNADDPCPADNPDDADGDGVCTSDDPCPFDFANDSDGDGVCDSEDPCPLGANDDSDGDGVCDSVDMCSEGDDTVDFDDNGVIDACDPSLILYLPFDEGAGTEVSDAAGNGHVGTLIDGTWNPGVYGNAIQLDGVDDYVDMGDILNDLELPLTVCAWLDAHSELAGTRATFFNSDNHPTLYHGVWVQGQVEGPVWRLSAHYGDGGGAGPEDRRSVVSDNTFNTFRWVHVCAVISDAGDFATYIDGVDNGHSYSGTGNAMQQGPGPLVIGYRETYGETFFDGRIDELRVYRRALSPAEVSALATP